jgi:hypothetical protein
LAIAVIVIPPPPAGLRDGAVAVGRAVEAVLQAQRGTPLGLGDVCGQGLAGAHLRLHPGHELVVAQEDLPAQRVGPGKGRLAAFDLRSTQQLRRALAGPAPIGTVLGLAPQQVAGHGIDVQPVRRGHLARVRLAVLVVGVDGLTAVATGGDVLDGAREFDAERAGHGRSVAWMASIFKT